MSNKPKNSFLLGQYVSWRGWLLWIHGACTPSIEFLKQDIVFIALPFVMMFIPACRLRLAYSVFEASCMMTFCKINLMTNRLWCYTVKAYDPLSKPLSKLNWYNSVWVTFPSIYPRSCDHTLVTIYTEFTLLPFQHLVFERQVCSFIAPKPIAAKRHIKRGAIAALYERSCYAELNRLWSLTDDFLLRNTPFLADFRSPTFYKRILVTPWTIAIRDEVNKGLMVGRSRPLSSGWVECCKTPERKFDDPPRYFALRSELEVQDSETRLLSRLLSVSISTECIWIKKRALRPLHPTINVSTS